jgi:hypothetical protein
LDQNAGDGGVIINPSLPSGHVTFCDDIRHEVTGKMTFVGVYNGQMIIGSELPAMIPQICANIELKLERNTEPFNVKIEVQKSDNSEPLFSFEADFDPAQADAVIPLPLEDESDAFRYVKLGINAPMQGIVITEPCTLKVRAYIRGDEIRLGALQVFVAPLEHIEAQSSN